MLHHRGIHIRWCTRHREHLLINNPTRRSYKKSTNSVLFNRDFKGASKDLFCFESHKAINGHTVMPGSNLCHFNYTKVRVFLRPLCYFWGLLFSWEKGEEPQTQKHSLNDILLRALVKMWNICVDKGTNICLSDYAGWNTRDLINEPCNHTYKTFHTVKWVFTQKPRSW